MNNILGTLGGVVIGVLLMVGVVYMVQNALAGSNASTAMGEVSTLYSNIKGMYAGTGNFGTLTNKIAEQAGAFPQNMLAGAVGAGSDIDPWGGTVTLAPAGTNNTEFAVSMDGIPSTSCSQMATWIGGSLVNVQINGGAALTPPIDGGTAASQCNKTGQGPGAGNLVSYTFN